MQSHLYAVAILACAGLVAAANFLPKQPGQNLHDNIIEELYDFEANTEPAHTRSLLSQLVDNFATYDDEDTVLTDEQRKERRLINLLADLDTLAVYRCNKKFFGGIHSLVQAFHYTSPALHKYVSDIRDRQTDFCLKFFDSKFSSYTSELDVALELLA